MQGILSNPFAVTALTFALAVLLTFTVRAFAYRFGFVAKPKSDRWHRRPTAMLGGAAIFFTTWIGYLLFDQKTPESLTVLAGASFLFSIGLIDDLINIKPYQKLVGQLFGAAFVVGMGLKLPLTGYELVDIWITVFWIVAITNAINLLDNMDGLAAGIAVIGAVSLALSFGSNGQTTELLFVTVFIGALLGFLVFNFNPASIFMGDCGSMFVGFLLSTLVLLNQIGGRSRGIVPILAVPVLILFVPIFDTTFVTILRKMRGRKATQGGRDHTSHRLVALGLSERNAVLMLYGFAICAGGISVSISHLETTQSLALITAFTALLAIIGVYLSKVKVYSHSDEEAAIQNNAVFAFLVDVSYKRRIFEVLLDTFLITLSYYFAYLLLFGPFERTSNWNLFISTLPILIVMKLFAFLALGVYRGLWRYTSIGDIVTFTKGVAAGSVLSIVTILFLYRFNNFSRAVFFVDALMLLAAIVGSRMTFRLFRILVPYKGSGNGRKALIYGAGDGGEMVFRELKNNPDWNYIPVGFIDDDPLKQGKVIHGLKVYDANGTLPEICRSKDIEEILVSSRDIPEEKLVEIKGLCGELNVSLKRAQIKIEPID
jgi:UDP-GlcNAc:undecaprenyl-phosphate GlcNAc-1-phosphate transferase